MKSKKKFIIISGFFFLVMVLANGFQNSFNVDINPLEKNDIDNFEEDEEILIIQIPKSSTKEDWYQYWRWTQWGNSGEDLVIDDSDNIYILGNTEDPGTGDYVIAIVKYNSEGEYQWNTTWGRNDGDVESKAIALGTDGNFYVVGLFYNSSTADINILLVKFNSIGEFQWYRIWCTPNFEFGHGISLDSSNNIYIAGEVWNDENVYGNITIISYDSSGIQRWNRTIGYEYGEDRASAIAVDSSDDIYIVGYSESYETYGGISDIIVFKYTNTGVQIWNSTWGGTLADEGFGIGIDSNFNVFIAGQLTNLATKPEPVIFKLNSTGDYQWSYSWTAETNAYGGEGRDIAIDSENKIYFSGFFDTAIPPSGCDYDVLVAKFNNSGEMLWNRTLDYGATEEKGNGIALDSKENIYIGGSKIDGLNDWFLTLKVLQSPGEFSLSSDAESPDLDGSFSLTWTPSDGAENYSIYEHNYYINEVNDTIKINEDLMDLTYYLSDKPNGTYYYKIVSFNKWGNESSNCIEITVLRIPPGAFTLSSNAGSPNMNGSFSLSWDISQYADNYSLYQHDSYISEFNDTIKIDEGLTNQSYIFKGLTNGTYYLRLVAFNINGNASTNCIQIEVKRYLPTGFTLDSDASGPDKDGNFNLNWTESLYAENYSIYQHIYYISEFNDSIKIGEGIEELIYPISDLSDGTYFFAIVAFNINGNRSSNCIQIEVENAPPGPFEFNCNATNPETYGVVLFWWNQSLDAGNYTLYYDTEQITDFNKNMFNITLIDEYSKIWPFLSNGEFYFTLVAFNRNGNYTHPTNILVIIRLAPKPLTLTSDADIPSDSDGNFKLNWINATVSKPDISNYSIYYSSKPFLLSDIGETIGIECLESNVKTTNFNCTKFKDGTFYYMIVAYNPYGNSSSNCLEIIISLPKGILVSGDGDDDDDENGNGDYSVIVAASIIGGVIGAATIGIILYKKKGIRTKSLDKAIKGKEEQ